MRPLFCRKLGTKLGRTKDAIWRWRMRILSAISGACRERFDGIVEVDETCQRESRKGSREWVRHSADPGRHPRPPRLQRHRCKSGRLKMQRGLSCWQLSLLALVDRSCSRLLERIPDRRTATIEAALRPVVAPDAVICSDKASACSHYARTQGLEPFEVKNAPGRRVASPAHHIQNVNALHSRCKSFIKPFRGPASKYLGGYLNWFLVQQRRSAEDLFAAVAA